MPKDKYELARQSLIDEGVNIALGIIQATQMVGPPLNTEQVGIITDGVVRALLEDACAEEIRDAIRRAHDDLGPLATNPPLLKLRRRHLKVVPKSDQHRD